MDKTLERIISTAKEKGITQKDICRSCGITETNFTQWKTGRTDTYKKHLKEIADLLGTTVNYLVDGEENEAEEFYRAFKAQPEYIQNGIKQIIKYKQ